MRIDLRSRYAEADPGDWTKEELEAMDARFVAALERAFRSGREHRESACAEFAGVSEGSIVLACYRATCWRRRSLGASCGGRSSISFV
jgi:hypothetical protein